MPVNYKLYPPDWKAISMAAKERAGWCCETCGVAHGAIGYRDKSGAFVQLADSVENAGMEVEIADLVDDEKIITIILTTAHVLNPDPYDTRPENLKALCQKCHNVLDMPMRKINASATRARKKAAGVLPLFEGAI